MRLRCACSYSYRTWDYFKLFSKKELQELQLRCKNGKRYAHTINPKTGYPIQHNILSATVLAPSCAMADAYATSFMVLGLEESQIILERNPELMAYFIYSANDGGNAVWFSPSMKGKIIE